MYDLSFYGNIKVKLMSKMALLIPIKQSKNGADGHPFLDINIDMEISQMKSPGPVMLPLL